MKLFILRLAKLLSICLLVFGLLGLIATISDPNIKEAGVIVFGIWCAISLLFFFLSHKRIIKLKNQIVSLPSNKSTVNTNSASVSVTISSMASCTQSIDSGSSLKTRNRIDEKTSISSTELDFSSVIHRYLTTDHSSVPSIYHYYDYYRAEFDCILNNIPICSIQLCDEKVLRNKEILTPYESSASITKRSNKEKLSNFVVIDTETTGIKVSGNDIIEVSAIKFENFIPVSAFTTLLKPRKPIPEEATKINGITDDMVATAPRFAQIKHSLEDFIGTYPIVAHNTEFDIKFLHVSGLAFSKNTSFFDTLTLSRKHIKDSLDGTKLSNYKLATVCEECNLYFNGAHRSLSDALATGLLFIEIIKRVFEVENINDIL